VVGGLYSRKGDYFREVDYLVRGWIFRGGLYCDGGTYRLFLIGFFGMFCCPLVLQAKSSEECEFCGIFEDEFTYISDMISRYPGHESLWCFRRFLWLYWFRLQTQHQNLIHSTNRFKKLSLHEMICM